MDQYKLISQETQAHFLIPYCSIPGQHDPIINKNDQNHAFGHFKPPKWYFSC